MEEKSIQKIIDTVELLTVDDKVKFEDNKEKEYIGKVVETQNPVSENKKNKLIKGDKTTEDCVLELLYDSEGGPITVKVSFKDGSANELNSIRVLTN